MSDTANSRECDFLIRELQVLRTRLELVNRALEMREIFVMTAPKDIHEKYWDACAPKLVTYRGGKLTTGKGEHTRVFTCALTTKDHVNTPGVFWLEKAPPPPTPFGYDRYYREDWGWTMERFQDKYVGFIIKNRIFFKDPIYLSYGQGPCKVGAMELPKVLTALKDLKTELEADMEVVSYGHFSSR